MHFDWSIDSDPPVLNFFKTYSLRFNESAEISGKKCYAYDRLETLCAVIIFLAFISLF